jgi:hypothetical protein
MPEDILNPFLARMVAWLRDQARKAGDAETGFMGDFLDVLDSALEQIAPANFAQHEARALLMGRPIALVRAAVDLQVRGLPAMNQSWEAYRAVLDNLPPTTDGFRDVRFPIRIGEHLRLQDGTIGYWIETGDGKFEQDRFYAPQSRQLSATDTEKNLLIYAGPDQDFNFYQAINAAPTIVSILMDPLGAVHCTTGVLPTKALRLPKEHYAGALKAINITFLSAPVLTERGQVHLPLPAEPGWGWSWVQRDGSRWTELSTTPVVEQEALLKAFPLHGEMIWNLLLQNGWLQRRNGSLQRATPQIKDRADFTQKLDALLHSNGVSHGSFDATDVLHVLDVSARFLGPVHTDARFGPATEIREGWLKLSREDDAYISPSAKTSQG